MTRDKIAVLVTRVNTRSHSSECPKLGIIKRIVKEEHLSSDEQLELETAVLRSGIAGRLSEVPAGTRYPHQYWLEQAMAAAEDRHDAIAQELDWR